MVPRTPCRVRRMIQGILGEGIQDHKYTRHCVCVCMWYLVNNVMNTALHAHNCMLSSIYPQLEVHVHTQCT